jgi:DNA primase
LNSSSREAVTQRIRDTVSIVDVVGNYVALHPAGANFKGLCPFHQDKSPSLYVHPTKQIFKCFACGAGGDVFSFVQLREKVDFLQARAMLAERAGIPLEDERSADRQGPGKVDLAKANRWAAGIFRRQLLGPSGAAARAYQTQRQINPEVSEEFGLGYALDGFEALLRLGRQSGYSEAVLVAAGLIRPSQRGGYHDTFRNRLVFPIIDTMDRVIGFGGRALGDDPAKYLNTPETALFEKGRGLFGLNRAKDAIGRAKRAIVVEGYMDCLMAHQFGFQETVAALGTAFTDEQAQLLRRYTDAVVLVFDSDEAGQRAADRALSVSLLQNLDVRLARVPSGKDPCDFLLSAGADAFTKLLIDAPSALEFKWRQVVTRYQSSETGPARRRAIEEFLERIATWVNAGAVDVIERGLILNQIAKLLSMPAGEVHTRLAALQVRAGRAQTGVGGSRTLAGAPTSTSTSASTWVPTPPRPDARQAALRELLQVLINEPRFVDQVQAGGGLEPQEISDPVLARVAAEVLEWCRQGRRETRWRVDELIGRFEDPMFARVVTDLQAAGERQGNFEATVQGALCRIREADCMDQAAAAGNEVRRLATREAQDAALMRAHKANGERRHFSPLSRIPRPG